MTNSAQRAHTLHGVLFVFLMAVVALYLSEMGWVKALSLSPLVVGILLGMVYANTLRPHMPEGWSGGVAFCGKRLLRLGIILYGFKLTLQDVVAVGWSAVVVDAIIVGGTIGLGLLLARLLRIDRSLALLTACGSAICGAAAVLGVDGVLRDKPYKTAVAVATVVIFGTLAMFLYPIAYKAGWVALSPEAMGIYTGSTVHEVAHVVGAGGAMATDGAGGNAVGSVAIIVKMLRVMMLVPVLLLLAVAVAKRTAGAGVAQGDAGSGRINIPWFAVLFLVVIAFNSVVTLPAIVLTNIHTLDTLLLTMAMTALGIETTFAKFKQAGAKPFLLAGVLWLWLIVGGYALAKYLVPLL